MHSNLGAFETTQYVHRERESVCCVCVCVFLHQLLKFDTSQYVEVLLIKDGFQLEAGFHYKRIYKFESYKDAKSLFSAFISPR
jgi:hypothetical protein